MFTSLHDFLRELERAGELRRITVPVSPLLEITEITDRMSKSSAASISVAARAFDPMHADLGGHALLFENVDGCDFPLAINVFGSYRRMELALGCASSGGFGSIARRIGALAQPKPPRSFAEAMRMGRQILPLLRIGPRLRRDGPCQEVVRLTERGEVDLMRLPLIKCWPLDGDPAAVNAGMDAELAGTLMGQGRYVTFAGMHTIHADDRNEQKPGSHNIGMYRAQFIDQTRLVMHWHVHHDGAAHWRSWKRLGRPMPIAICLGGESVLPYAATAPLPPGISELLMAGFLQGRGIEVVPAKTVPLRVPANCEIVIEGYVSTECGHIGYDPDRGEALGAGAAFEGPFGDHTGFYSLPDRYPIMEVTAVTHRREAVFPATIVGYPPQEDYYLGKATERIFLPLLQTLIPDIVDYHLPQFGCFHNCAFIAIDKAYPLQGRRVMHAVWGAGQMAWTKMIIVVDSTINVHDEEAVLRALFEHCDFHRDMELVHGPLDILDHAAPHLGAGCKIGFDATRKVPGEETNGVAIEPPFPLASSLESDPQWRRLFERFRDVPGAVDVALPDFGGGRCLFMSIDKVEAGQGPETFRKLWKHCGPGVAELAVLVDARVDVHDWQNTLFHMCANVDPGRDIEHNGHHIGIDATTKLPGDARHGSPVRPFPPIMEMDDATRSLVDQRWPEYGLL